MPTRLIREGLLDSERINGISRDAELFYIHLMLVADDYGRFDSRTRLLRSRTFPVRDGIRDQDIERWKAELHKAGLVVFYSVGSKQIGALLDTSQQTKSKSRFPGPPAEVLEKLNLGEVVEGEGKTKRYALRFVTVRKNPLESVTDSHLDGDGDGDGDEDEAPLTPKGGVALAAPVAVAPAATDSPKGDGLVGRASCPKFAVGMRDALLPLLPGVRESDLVMVLRDWQRSRQQKTRLKDWTPSQVDLQVRELAKIPEADRWMMVQEAALAGWQALMAEYYEDRKNGKGKNYGRGNGGSNRRGGDANAGTANAGGVNEY